MAEERKIRKIIVAYSREFNNYDMLFKELDNYIYDNTFDDEEIVLVSGETKERNSLVEQYADDCDYEIIRYKPDWEEHGKSAWFRNQERMIDECTDLVVFADKKFTDVDNLVKYAGKKRFKNMEIHEYEKPTKPVENFKLPNKSWELLYFKKDDKLEAHRNKELQKIEEMQQVEED